MASSLIIKIRRRKESDLHGSFFIEGNYDNLKRLQNYYYYHLCREDNNYDTKDNNKMNNNKVNDNNNNHSIFHNDDSFQCIKNHVTDNLCMISSDISPCYICQEINCNQSFDSLIKVNNYISMMMIMIMLMIMMTMMMMMIMIIDMLIRTMMVCGINYLLNNTGMLIIVVNENDLDM